MNTYQCDECKDTYENTDGSGCSECCPHDEHDHGICLNCDKDCTDDLVAQAEYAFEGDR